MTKKAWRKGAVASVLLYVLKYPIFVELSVILLTEAHKRGCVVGIPERLDSPTCRNIPSSSTILHNQRVSSSQQECAVRQRLAKLSQPWVTAPAVRAASATSAKNTRSCIVPLRKVETMDRRAFDGLCLRTRSTGWQPALSTSPTSPGSRVRLAGWRSLRSTGHGVRNSILRSVGVGVLLPGNAALPRSHIAFPSVPPSMPCRKTRSHQYHIAREA
ncbi:uncharacterized protein BDZ83DRAFT_179845 [Colletotrichum acutatum]|uniref:Uncharacterized protein n=1 Tax=Glomerella acutata TaxID=27357 RepID=A0AAD8XJE4_GLOAC|nr:uncharacterized protein BDZ83DRAFT_179845 [Colletotrichum acutatum]KAK1727888.1 hypothetical protein BDZ83DRAFT_179845 [Colletotrichum acutatum]